MPKISIVGNAARDAAVRGADYLAAAVGASAGPWGLNMLSEKGNYASNDGFTISTQVAPTVKDEFERRGALALHEASAKTNDTVADGTTSSIILAQAIMKEAIRLLPNDKSLTSKKKPSEIIKMIEESKANVIKQLHGYASEISTEIALVASAKVSVEDDNLAKLIGSTQWQIGKNGFIIAEEVNETTSSVDIVKGIRIDNGFGTPVVITDQVNQRLEVNETPILLTNYTMQDNDLLTLLNKVVQNLVNDKKNQLVVIARAFSAEAIKLCSDSMQKGFNIYPINAPYVYQSEIMKDLAAITGAKYYDTEESRLEDFEYKDLGYATKVLARRFDAIITGPDDTDNIVIQDAINTRIKQLEEKLTGPVSDFERKGIEERIAQFKGGFAILKVGAPTVFERKYLKDKADDAVSATRLALRGGVVKGAGLAFKEISDTLDDDDILKRPLLSIYNQIISSAPADFVIEDWVKDPVLVLEAALTNACSVAGQFASVNVIVTTKDKKEKNEDAEE